MLIRLSPKPATSSIMERTHTPLSVWFGSACLLTSLTPGMSAIRFQRQLGLSRYETAFQIFHMPSLTQASDWHFGQFIMSLFLSDNMRYRKV